MPVATKRRERSSRGSWREATPGRAEAQPGSGGELPETLGERAAAHPAHVELPRPVDRVRRRHRVRTLDDAIAVREAECRVLARRVRRARRVGADEERSDVDGQVAARDQGGVRAVHQAASAFATTAERAAAGSRYQARSMAAKTAHEPGSSDAW